MTYVCEIAINNENILSQKEETLHICTLHIICTPSIYARPVLFPSSGTLYILHCTVLFTSRYLLYMKFTFSICTRDFVQLPLHKISKQSKECDL